MNSKKIVFILCFLLVLLILSAYSNSLFAPFALDDTHSFVIEPKVLNFTFSLSGFAELAKTKFGLARFLPMLTFALDLQWGSGSLMAFHISNVLIHLLTAMALFLMLRNILSLHCCCGECKKSFSRANYIGLMAVCVAGIWSLHPVQTNAVTYIVQRMTSISTLFYFFSINCYVQGRKKQKLNNREFGIIVWYSGCLFFWLCSMMSKEIAATLPVMLLLVEWLVVEKSGVIHFAKKHRLSVCIVLIALVLLVVYKISTGLLDGYSLRHFTLSERLLTELRIVAKYIFILLVPLPGILTLEHDPSLSTSLFSPPTTFLSLCLICAIFFSAWKVRKKYPLITFGFAWFFINLLIESSIVPLELMFEHRLYLPSAGFYFACFMILQECYRNFFSEVSDEQQRLKMLIAMMVVLFSCLSLATFNRNMVWQDSVTLYRDCLRKAPNKPRVHSNLAKALAVRGEYEESLIEGEKALALGEKGYEVYWVAASNIVSALSQMGENDVALARAKIFIDKAQPWNINKAYALFLCYLGNIYLEELNYKLALVNYIKGLKFSIAYDIPYTSIFERNIIRVWNAGLKDDYVFDTRIGSSDIAVFTANDKLAKVFFDLNQNERALEYCHKVLLENPFSITGHGIKDKIEKIQIDNDIQQKKGTIKNKYFNHPFTNKFNFYMATAYVLMKFGLKGTSVQNVIQQAGKIHPNHIDISLLKSWLLFKRDLFEAAICEIDKAIAKDQNYAQLWINRGIYALALHKNIEALTAFSKALKLYPAYPHRGKIKSMIVSTQKGMERKNISTNNPYIIRGVNCG